MRRTDRHAQKELKKQVRGVRPIERGLAERTDEEAAAVRGYCLAVRSALTDEGPPPLDPAGLRLEARLQKQGRVILALDGLQPDVGQEVLWVLRDCGSGEVLLARSLLGATEEDLVPLRQEVATVCRTLEVPIRRSDC